MQASTNRPRFIDKQLEFTSHIRDPENRPRPDDISKRRMDVYNDLLFNAIEGGVSFCFPITKEILSEDHWNAMIRDFFIVHRCQKHAYREVPGEFLDYLLHERGDRPEDPVFLRQFMHYEWVELALSISQEVITMDGVRAEGDLLEKHPVISPLAWVLSYDFAVHKISKEFQPQQTDQEKTFLIVYRDRDDEMGFMETNATTARLLDILEEDDTLTGRQALQKIAEETQHPEPEVVIQGGQQILADLLQRDIVLGTH